MGMMPISTYKPPTFGLIEDYFNDAQHGLIRRWAALLKLASLNDPHLFDPSVAGAGRFAPVSDRQIDHFTEHWIAATGNGGWYWPGFQGFEDEVRRRLVKGFIQALSFSVLPTGPDTSVLESPKKLLKPQDYPTLDLLWVCSNPDSKAAEFLVRPLVYECDVNVIFLTPWPDGISMPPGPGLGTAGGQEPRIGSEAPNPGDFPNPGTLQAAQEEHIDALNTVAGVPTCCPRWHLPAVFSFVAKGLTEFIESVVQPQTDELRAAFAGDGAGSDVRIRPAQVADEMNEAAANPLFNADARRRFIAENGVAELLAAESVALDGGVSLG